MVNGSLLLAAAPAAPLVLAALWLVPRLRPLAVAAAPAAPLPALVLALWPAEVATVSLPWFFLGSELGLDTIGRAFLFLTAALWTAAGVFAAGYVRDRRRTGFFGLHLLTCAGNLTLVVAQDMLTFYLGFVLMTFAAYGLVVHTRSATALRAGRIYVVVALIGEAFLLAGLLWAGSAAPDWSFENLPLAFEVVEWPAILTLLFLLGFGVKAGLIPLHVWLPLAHPVAPTPASAVLSGAMIKAGLLGWMRFLPIGVIGLAELGTALIVAGVAGAFLAVFVGLGQDDAKTVLAYSSVSQMGYMATGVGIGLLVPAAAPVALLAVSHYAAHHALAKGALFLAVGVASHAAPARRGRFLVYAATTVPVLALAGAPFTSGAAAKSALKHTGEALPAEWAGVLALMLSIAAIGTTVLLARFLDVLPADQTGGRRSSGSRSAAVALWGAWLPTLLLSATAIWWLPFIHPPPPGVVEPLPVLGIADTLWPVGIGVILAAAAWRYRHHVPWLRHMAVPAGDLVVPVTAALRRTASSAPAIPWERYQQLLTAALVALKRTWRRAGGRAAVFERRLVEGAGTGIVLFVTLAVLAAAMLLS